jgi:hypothetical protein
MFFEAEKSSLRRAPLVFSPILNEPNQSSTTRSEAFRCLFMTFTPETTGRMDYEDMERITADRLTAGIENIARRAHP